MDHKHLKKIKKQVDEEEDDENLDDEEDLEDEDDEEIDQLDDEETLAPPKAPAKFMKKEEEKGHESGEISKLNAQIGWRVFRKDGSFIDFPLEERRFAEQTSIMLKIADKAEVE